MGEMQLMEANWKQIYFFRFFHSANLLVKQNAHALIINMKQQLQFFS